MPGVAGRMVHLDARRRSAAPVSRSWMHHLAREQLGHAGRVVVDDELLQLDRERQLLQQHAVGLVQDRDAATARPRAPACCRGRSGCRGDRRCCGATSAISRRRCTTLLPLNQHLGAHDQVAVEQAAEADQHDRAVRRDVAELVGAPPARAATIQPSPSRVLQLDLPAAAGRAAAPMRLAAASRRLARARPRPLWWKAFRLCSRMLSL